ncbi:MAG: 4Fe-4S binding protein [Euryarchaeota archaeon]|nr:4Fe-4S binding protein [Euryarchaeota archaeon]
MQQPSQLIWKAFVDENLCVGCGKCTEVCWTGAIRIIDKKAVIDVNKCICCAICVRTCPRGAIRIVPYSFPILQREEAEDLDEIKAQLRGIGTQLEGMERSIEEL